MPKHENLSTGSRFQMNSTKPNQGGEGCGEAASAAGVVGALGKKPAAAKVADSNTHCMLHSVSHY